MKLAAFILNCLQHRRATGLVALLAVCLTAPSLFVGFATDDHNLRAVFQGYPGMPEVTQAPWDAFRFHFSPDPETRQARLDRGLLPWWAGEETRTAFLRPLTSLSHWLDWQLFGERAWPMHLHNMAIFALLLGAVGLLYRNLLAPGYIAVLALMLYGIDDARGLPVGWLSARNSLLTALFGVGVLLCHDQGRRLGKGWALPLGLLCLVLGLGCGEAAVSVGGYLFAYALFLDPAGFRRGFIALLPYGAIVVAWQFLYTSLGYGTYASGGYVNPTEEPLLFLYRIGERLPVLFFGAFGLPDCTFYNFLPAPWSKLYWMAAFAFVAFVLWALRPLLREDVRARFWLVGMALSALPACLTSPQDRMLMFPAVGAMALVALFFGRVTAARERGESMARPVCLLAGFWAGAHLVLAPLLLLVGSYAIALVEAAAREANGTLPGHASVAAETVVLVHTMSDLMGPAIPIFRASLNEPVPRHTYMLSAGNQAATVGRPDAHTLIIRPEGGYLLPTWAELFRNPAQEPLGAGDTVVMDGLTATVLEADGDGRPAAVAFRFDAPLEDSRYHWYYWTGRAYAPFELPAVGGEQVIARPAAW